MKIWLLHTLDKALVIQAETEEDARSIAYQSGESSFSHGKEYLSPKQCVCAEITLGESPGIILEAYID